MQRRHVSVVRGNRRQSDTTTISGNNIRCQRSMPQRWETHCACCSRQQTTKQSPSDSVVLLGYQVLNILLSHVWLLRWELRTSTDDCHRSTRKQARRIESRSTSFYPASASSIAILENSVPSPTQPLMEARAKHYEQEEVWKSQNCSKNECCAPLKHCRWCHQGLPKRE